jgi:chromosome segregation ATPase
MTRKSDEAGPEEPPIAEVDRIRDIIFGSQMRTYEQQFKRVAGQLDQINKQLDELKANLGRQRQDLEGQILKLREATQQSQSEMERTFSNQLAQSRSEFTQGLDALEDAKTSRSHLGELLIEMGTRLKQQGDISDLLGQLGKASAKQPK